MRKQSLLFSESYIMDKTTVAPHLKSPEEEQRGGGEGERVRPSIFDKEPFFGEGQVLD